MKTDGKNLLLNTEMNFPKSADKDQHLMRYTLLQEKNHHMAFLSQFWPLSDHSGAGVGLECYAGKLDFVNGRTATYAVIDSHYLNIDSLGTGLKKT